MEPNPAPNPVKGIFPHKFTRADSIKGGRAKSAVKTLHAQMNTRVYCDSKCPLYLKCWVKDILKKSDIKIDPKEVWKKFYNESNGRWKCALKGQSSRMQSATYNLFLNGEEGIIDMMRQVGIKLFANTKLLDNTDLRLLLRDLKLMLDSFYGQKHRTELSGKVDLTQEFMDAVRESVEDDATEE